MVIGSHTHSHFVLSQIEPREQVEELTQVAGDLERDHLKVEADLLAYPVRRGGTVSLKRHRRLRKTRATARLFRFYGGTNPQGKISPYNLNRVCMGDQSRNRFWLQMAVCRSTGKFWP